MSPEGIAAVLVALAAVITALGVTIGQIAALRKAVDGRLSQLVEATRLSATKEGELQGRDFVGGPRAPSPPEMPQNRT